MLNNTAILIYKLREKYKMTQTDLANAVGVKKESVCNWESGKTITIEHLYDIASYFNISVRELLDGKLDDIESINYLNRVYNIEDIELDDEISDENIPEFKEYLSKVLFIQNNFFLLTKQWALDQLSGFKHDEYKFLKKYFVVDGRYFDYLKSKYGETNSYFKDNNSLFTDNREKEIVKRILYNANNNEEELKWELSKLYLRNFDIKKDLILESGNLVLLEMLINILTTYEKDCLLTGNLIKKEATKENYTNCIYYKDVKLSVNEIEENNAIKLMLNKGCRALMDFDKTEENEYKLIDETTFNLLLGNKEEIMTRSFYDDSHENDLKYSFDLSNESWKKLTLKEYEELINYKKTDYLNAIFKYREDEPLKYFEELKKYL